MQVYWIFSVRRPQYFTQWSPWGQPKVAAGERCRDREDETTVNAWTVRQKKMTVVDRSKQE